MMITGSTTIIKEKNSPVLLTVNEEIDPKEFRG